MIAAILALCIDKKFSIFFKELAGYSISCKAYIIKISFYSCEGT